MKKLLCPSMMCADFTILEEEMKNLENAKVDCIHCDVMDGTYVPNLTLGLQDIKAIRSLTELPIDVHLMIENPSDKVDWFLEVGADIIYLHSDSGRNINKTLMKIRNKGAKSGIAIGPDQSVEEVYELLYNCDYILFMTVNPGFAGQKFMEFTKHKLNKIIKLKEKFGFKIIIDGACSIEVIDELNQVGADGYVLGTSSLFMKGSNYADNIRKIRELEGNKDGRFEDNEN